MAAERADDGIGLLTVPTWGSLRPGVVGAQRA
jgi:hypothetical protein